MESLVLVHILRKCLDTTFPVLLSSLSPPEPAFTGQEASVSQGSFFYLCLSITSFYQMAYMINPLWLQKTIDLGVRKPGFESLFSYLLLTCKHVTLISISLGPLTGFINPNAVIDEGGNINVLIWWYKTILDIENQSSKLLSQETRNGIVNQIEVKHKKGKIKNIYKSKNHVN